MKRFITSYVQGGRPYASHVWAKNWADAQEKVKLRNINEWIQGESIMPPPESNEPLDEFAKLHEAIFLSFIALKMGIITVDEVLGDNGVVHLMAHSMVGATTDERVNSDWNLEWLRHLIPGYLKPINEKGK